MQALTPEKPTAYGAGWIFGACANARFALGGGRKTWVGLRAADADLLVTGQAVGYFRSGLLPPCVLSEVIRP